MRRLFLLALWTALAGCGSRTTVTSTRPNTVSGAPDQVAYDRAVGAYDAGRYAAARRQFEALLLRSRGTPLNGHVRYYLARIDGQRDKARGGAALMTLATRDDISPDLAVLADVEGAALWAEAGRCEGVAPRIQRRLDQVSDALKVRATAALATCAKTEQTLVTLSAAASSEPAQRATYAEQASDVAKAAPIDDLAAAVRSEGSGPLGSVLRAQLAQRAAAESRPDLIALASGDPQPSSTDGSAVVAPKPGPRVGLVLPLSGRSRRLGERLAETARVLFGGEDRPDGTPDVPVHDGGDPQAATAAIDALAAADAVGVVGVFDGATAGAAAAAAARHGLPLVMLTLSDAAVTTKGPTWRGLHTPLLVARTAAGAAIARGAKRAAVIHADDGYGTTLASWFRQAWQAGGGTFAGDVTWSKAKPVNFASIAKRARGLKADVFFIPVDPSTAAELLSHLAAAKVFIKRAGKRFEKAPDARQVVVIGPPEWYDERLIRQGGRYVEGALIPVPFAVETARGAQLDARVSGALGRAPNVFDALMADAVQAVVAARGRAGSDDGVAAALATTPYVDGYSAGLHFDQRDAVQALFLMEVSQGKMKPTQ